MMADDSSLAVLKEILNWTRAASFRSVKTLLEEALPDRKSRAAFQMLDRAQIFDQVRVTCKLSPNVIVALAQKCVAMGLMEVREDKKRARLFNLDDFDLDAPENEIDGRGK